MQRTQHNRVQIHEFIRGLRSTLLHTPTSLFALKCFMYFFNSFSPRKHQEISRRSVFYGTFHFQLQGWIFNFSQILSTEASFALVPDALSQKLYGIGKYLP